jgi:DNA-binding protein HU-beta
MANINKDAIVDVLALRTGFSKKDIEATLEGFMDTVTEEVRKGNKVTLTGFGTFRLSERAAREGINPQTKEKITIPAMKVPKFTAGKSLKEAVR